MISDRSQLMLKARPAYAWASTGRSSPRPTHAWASTGRSSPQDSPTPQQADKHHNLSLATRTQQAEKHHMPCRPTARWPGPTGTCLFIFSPIRSSRCLMIPSIIRSVIQSVIVTVIHWILHSSDCSLNTHTCIGTPTGHQRDTNGTPRGHQAHLFTHVEHRR